jgi:hypothetical protein
MLWVMATRQFAVISHNQSHLHCRTSDTQTKAMRKSLSLPPATQDDLTTDKNDNHAQFLPNNSNP